MFFVKENINENIPRDLAIAYNRANGFPSHRHEDTDHNVMGNHFRRRRSNYDYGKSTYKEITKEEALKLVKENKHNVENLRILFDGKLVEFEVRNNGEIYSIYGDSDYSVEIDGKYYRNIREVSWRKVLMNSDKVYYTDEYQHPISVEKANDRTQKQQLRKIELSLPKGDADYDEHDMEHNILCGKKYYSADVLDTGNHAGIEFGSNDYEYNAANSSFRDYNEALKRKKKAFVYFDSFRNAIKKLENNKSEYDEDVYEELLTKLNNRKAVAVEEYKDCCKKFNDAKSKILFNIDKLTADKKAEKTALIKTLSKALSRCHNIKREMEKFQLKDVNMIMDPEGWQSNTPLQTLDRLIDNLEKAKKSLEEATSDNDSSNIENIENDIVYFKSEILRRTQELQSRQKRRIQSIIADVKEYELELADAIEEYSKTRVSLGLKPKGRGIQHTGKADDSIAHVLDFKD